MFFSKAICRAIYHLHLHLPIFYIFESVKLNGLRISVMISLKSLYLVNFWVKNEIHWNFRDFYLSSIYLLINGLFFLFFFLFFFFFFFFLLNFLNFYLLWIHHFFIVIYWQFNSIKFFLGPVLYSLIFDKNPINLAILKLYWILPIYLCRLSFCTNTRQYGQT